MGDSITVVGMVDAVYTHGHHDSVLRSHRWRTAANSAAYLLPHLRPGMGLLDIGCGPGTITADLAEVVAPGRVTAIDAIADPLAEARAFVRSRGLSTVDFEIADVHQLPYAEGTFDVVHAHQVLQHVSDPVQALREMKRVCRTGGIVAARDGDYAAMNWFPLLPELDDWQTLYRTVARSNGGEPDAGRRLLSWAHAAGLDGVVSTASAWCFATPEDRDWWADLWAERVENSALADGALRCGYSRADLARIADGWRSWAAERDGWFLAPHGEIRCTL